MKYFRQYQVNGEFRSIDNFSDCQIIVAENRVDSDEIVERFNLDGSIVSDAWDKHELPRMEISDGREYFFLRFARHSSKNNVFTLPILCIVSNERVFVIADHCLNFQDFVGRKNLQSSGSSKDIFLAIFAELINDYAKFMKKSGLAVNNLKYGLKNHEITNADLVGFIGLEADFREFQSNLDGMGVVISRMMKIELKEERLDKIEDIHLQVNQLRLIASNQLQSIKSIREVYTVIANNTLNERMKILTLMTILVALPNVFYGMYGMNIDLPMSDHPLAFPVVIGTSVLLILLVFLLAKRSKLL